MTVSVFIVATTDVGCYLCWLARAIITGRAPYGRVRRSIVHRAGMEPWTIDPALTIGAAVFQMAALAVPATSTATIVLYAVWGVVLITDLISEWWGKFQRWLGRSGEKGRVVLARMISRLKPAPVRRPGLAAR